MNLGPWLYDQSASESREVLPWDGCPFRGRGGLWVLQLVVPLAAQQRVGGGQLSFGCMSAMHPSRDGGDSGRDIMYTM